MNATIINNTSSNTDIAIMWAEGIIDHSRFACDEDRFLARYEETDTLMPSADDLAALGFDLVALATALEAGLDPALFGKAYPMVDVAEFNLAAAAGLDIDIYNEGLDHLADIVAESRIH